MSFCQCTGAILQCPFGIAPTTFSALPTPRVLITGRPAGVMTEPYPGEDRALIPSPKVFIGGQPAITDGSKLMCAWGGQISVQFAGQTSVQL